MPLSSSGLGYQVLILETGVRLPVGVSRRFPAFSRETVFFFAISRNFIGMATCASLPSRSEELLTRRYLPLHALAASDSAPLSALPGNGNRYFSTSCSGTPAAKVGCGPHRGSPITDRTGESLELLAKEVAPMHWSCIMLLNAGAQRRGKSAVLGSEKKGA